MNDEEEWRPVVGWEDAYEVSSFGRVRSISRIVMAKDGRCIPLQGRPVTPVVIPKGYLQVRLWRDNRPHPIYVHKLVLNAFVGIRPENLQARHLDGDPSNNRLDNLAWGTGSENTNDRVFHGTHNQAVKTHCPRGHLLVEPNLRLGQLRRGKRTCLACHREYGLARYYGRPFDEKLADGRYEMIMQGVAV